MIRTQDSTGTFPFGLWYEEEEIEKIMEDHRARFFRTGIIKTATPFPIELFLEKYVPTVIGREVNFDPYADVESKEGSGIWGATYFYHDHVDVKIDYRLTKQADQSIDKAGPYLITIAHEASHCLMHAELLETNSDDENISSTSEQPQSICPSYDFNPVESDYDGRWWEVQANRGMAALMMPRDEFLFRFKRERKAYGMHDNVSLQEDEHKFGAVVGFLSRNFGVSKQAVKIRLIQLGQIKDDTKREKSFSGKSGLQPVQEILRDFFRGYR